MSQLGSDLLWALDGNAKSSATISGLYPQSITGVLGLVGLQLSACVFGLGFTRPDSLLRPALLTVIGGSVLALGQTCTDIMPRFVLSNILGGITCGWATQYIVSVFLNEENFEDEGPSAAKGGKNIGIRDGIMPRIMFGLNKINSQRNIGTPREAKNVPPFSHDDPSYIPSRFEFLLKTGSKAVGSYLVLDFLTSKETDISQNPILFAADKVPFFSRLSEISTPELGIRAASSIGHWVGFYFFLQFIHSSLAFGTVLAGLYEPKGWPPLFGSLQDIYSIRQFWGVFWHQMMRPKLEAVSSFFTKSLFGIPKGTYLRRYADVFGVFLTSGICHVMMDVWGSIPLRECGAIQFFCTQAFGIMFEDSIQAIYRRARGVERTEQEPSAWIKVLGFAWTTAFCIWSTPQWIYPGLRHATTGPKTQLLPFSIVKLFLE